MRISEQVLEDFGGYLAGEEKSGATVEKYIREARRFMGWLAGREAGVQAEGGAGTEKNLSGRGAGADGKGVPEASGGGEEAEK